MTDLRVHLLAWVGILLAAPAASQNLFPNGGFDSGLAPWTPFTLPTFWDALDADGSPSSGSVRVDHNLPGSEGGIGGPAAVSPCIPVGAGSYDLNADFLLPLDQGSEGEVRLTLQWYSDATCTTSLPGLARVDLSTDDSTGEWTRVSTSFALPAGAGWVRGTIAMARHDASGSLTAYLDNAALCSSGTCDSETGEWITDPQYPDFRFRVTITPEGEPSFPGRKEASCQPEVVCVSGALPGRSEVFVRILGPRPNGYLWPTIVRFTPSKVEVEIEQISTLETNLYTLDAVPSGEVTDLSGLQDREGFLP